MNWKPRRYSPFFVFVVMLVGPLNAIPDNHWYGGEADLAFASDLWKALLNAQLVGKDAKDDTPYEGTHPHGAILESVISSVVINKSEGMVVVKRSYRGNKVSVASVSANRERFLDDITVMFKREQGYDPENQNWFWAKYNKDGSLAATPNGIKLAGRIAKGKRKGCIACHRKADGDDYLFIN